MNILISGCSFSGSNWGLLEHHRINNVSRCGAGNQYIADSVIANLHTNPDLVVVMFTGVYRVDMIVPEQYGLAWVGDYEFHTHLDNRFYIHGGGILGGWPRLKPNLAHYFQSQYKAMDVAYLEWQGMQPVIACLRELHQRDQKFLWGWIYDTGRDYQKESFGHSLGQVKSAWHELDQFRDCCIKTTPLEYCQNQGEISPDGFHPTHQGYQNFGLDHILPFV